MHICLPVLVVVVDVTNFETLLGRGLELGLGFPMGEGAYPQPEDVSMRS